MSQPVDVVGIDIGASKWMTLRRCEHGDHVGRGQTRADPGETLAAITRSLDRLCCDAPLTMTCAFAGLVDMGGTVACWPNRPTWVGYPLVSALNRGADLVVEDDALCAAVGEWRTRSVDTRRLLCVTMGSGVGSGSVLEGEPQRPVPGSLGLGHVGIGSDSACTCGATGCVQATVRRWLDARSPWSPLDDERPMHWGSVIRAIEGAAEAIAADAVVLTGGVCRHRPALIDAMRDDLRSRNEHRFDVTVADQPDRSAVVGAFDLALLRTREADGTCLIETGARRG